MNSYRSSRQSTIETNQIVNAILSDKIKYGNEHKVYIAQYYKSKDGSFHGGRMFSSRADVDEQVKENILTRGYKIVLEEEFMNKDGMTCVKCFVI